MARFARISIHWILPSTAIAAALFLLNYTAVISGALAPPPGHVPQYVLRNIDMTVYLNWMQSARDRWLLPNYSAPWLTPDEVFTPILTVMGRLSNLLPWSTLTDYYVLHFIATIGASALLLAALRYFLPSRKQRLAAVAVIFCSVPYLSIAYAIAKATGSSPGIFSLGLLEYTYTTADGLVRGGASNSVTLTFGTATVLAAVLLLAKRIETGSVRWLWAAAAVNFASALFHPFEFSVITAAGCSLLALEARRTRNWRRAVWQSLVLVSAAVAGLTPYLVQLRRVEWLRDMSAADPGATLNVASVLLMWGLPAFLTLYTMLLRFRPATPKDEVLAVWCITALVVLFAHPPSPFHLLNGYTYINAMWLVRVAASNHKARSVIERNRRPLIAFCSIWFVLCAAAHAATIIQMARDGRSPDPDVLVSTVAPQSETVLRGWLHAHAEADEVVMAPGLTGAWLTTIPMHGFAAQDNFSITYEQQLKESRSFFAAKWSPDDSRNFLRRYGIRWVVVPANSEAQRYFSTRPPAASFGDLVLYQLPENHTVFYDHRHP
jgi:hypothetical protein